MDQSVVYSKYCGVPKQEIDVCPTVGWVRDFADPLTVLYVPFYGPAITQTNHSSWGQVNDPVEFAVGLGEVPSSASTAPAGLFVTVRDRVDHVPPRPPDDSNGFPPGVPGERWIYLRG